MCHINWEKIYIIEKISLTVHGKSNIITIAHTNLNKLNWADNMHVHSLVPGIDSPSLFSPGQNEVVQIKGKLINHKAISQLNYYMENHS